VREIVAIASARANLASCNRALKLAARSRPDKDLVLVRWFPMAIADPFYSLSLLITMHLASTELSAP
jgi:hypothetical protein